MPRHQTQQTKTWPGKRARRTLRRGQGTLRQKQPYRNRSCRGGRRFGVKERKFARPPIIGDRHTPRGLAGPKRDMSKDCSKPFPTRRCRERDSQPSTRDGEEEGENGRGEGLASLPYETRKPTRLTTVRQLLSLTKNKKGGIETMKEDIPAVGLSNSATKSRARTGRNSKWKKKMSSAFYKKSWGARS